MQNLAELANAEHCLFTPNDLRALLPDLSDSAFKTLLSRAAQEGHLAGVCRGLYLLRVLSSAGLLTRLTFFGGSCLRACYGSNRLSEDRDFAGGADFSRKRLSAIGNVLVESFKAKYGLWTAGRGERANAGDRRCFGGICGGSCLRTW